MSRRRAANGEGKESTFLEGIHCGRGRFLQGVNCEQKERASGSSFEDGREESL
jgi:hypothetical protein